MNRRFAVEDLVRFIRIDDRVTCSSAPPIQPPRRARCASGVHITV